MPVMPRKRLRRYWVSDTLTDEGSTVHAASSKEYCVQSLSKTVDTFHSASFSIA